MTHPLRIEARSYDAAPLIYDLAQRFVYPCALKASRYTGKERDAESGLDYFGARYYASNMGRWMSPDWADKPEAVPYSKLDDPQSLNLYGYVLNNPLSKADPDGHCCVDDFKADRTESQRHPTPLTAGEKAAMSQAWHESGLGKFIDNHPTLVGYVEGAIIAGLTHGAGAEPTPIKIPEMPAATPAPSVPESIPAGPGARPSPTQQSAINEMGEAHGCSTCGTTSPGTKTGNWVGDHQPPTKLNPTNEPQVYKPQCLQCSRQQGGKLLPLRRLRRRLKLLNNERKDGCSASSN